MDLLALLLDGSESKVGMASGFFAMRWECWSLLWSRAGLLFSVFPSAVLSNLGVRKVSRARGPGQRAMGGLCMVPEPGEEVGSIRSCLFMRVYSPPTPVLPSRLPPRALCA